MANLGTLTLDLIAKTGGFTRPLNKAGRSVKKFEKETHTSLKITSSAMNAVKVGATAVGVAMGVLAVKGTAAAIRIGANFQQQMTNVQGVMRASNADMSRLTETAKRMGATTAWTASQSAEALEYMGMAGYSAQDSIKALPGLLNLATAGALDLGRASDIVTDSLTAMGMSVDELGRFNDVLTGTITRSNTNIEMMGESLKYVAPVASQLGYEIEQVAAYLGILANAGIKGSDAGTDLRKALIDNRKAAKELGTEQNDLIGTLKAAREAQWGVNEIVSAYGIRVAKSVLVLMDQIEAYDELEETLHNVNGETDELAKKKLDTLIGDFKLLKSAVEGLGIELFDSLESPLRKSVQLVTELAKGISIEVELLGGKSFDFIKTERTISEAIEKGGQKGINELITHVEYLKSKWKEQNEETQKWKDKLDQINSSIGNVNASTFVKKWEKERDALNSLEEQLGITQLALDDFLSTSSSLPKSDEVDENSGKKELISEKEKRNLESWYDHWKEYDIQVAKDIYEYRKKQLDDEMAIIDESLEYLKWAAEEEEKIEKELTELRKELNKSYWDEYLTSLENNMNDMDSLVGNTLETTTTRFGNFFSKAIMGTKSVKEAWKDMGTGLSETILAAIGQMISQWLVYKAVRIATGKEVQAAAAPSLIANAQAASLQAGINAYSSAAAVPVVGWQLAPAAMADALSVTGGMAAAISALALSGIGHSGIDYIPEDGSWFLKKGEKIVAPNTSQKLDNTLDTIIGNVGGNNFSGSSSGERIVHESHFHYHNDGPVFLDRSHIRDVVVIMKEEEEREMSRRGAII